MKRSKDLRIGSWNVLSLYRPKSLQILLDQLEKHYVDITCVQEMRWIGSGTIEKKDWIFFTAVIKGTQARNRICNSQEGETSYYELPIEISPDVLVKI
jgi:hypothetical protein